MVVSRRFIPLLVGLLLLVSTSFSWEGESLTGFQNADSSYKAAYQRISEVQKRCPFPSSFSSDGGEDPGPDPKWVIQNELSFQNGDWLQAPNAKLLLIASADSSSHNKTFDPIQLVSFWITDVNLRSKSGLVKISAILQLAITTERSISYFTSAAESLTTSDEFSALTMLLEGVYFETKTQRGVCMVGCRQLAGAPQSSCDLYLELHFPVKFSLQSREINGFLKSTAPAAAAFDDVKIVSQLGSFSRYEFGDVSRLHPACDRTSPQQKVNVGMVVYQRHRFCGTLMQILTGNWIELHSGGPFPEDSFQMRVLDIRCADYVLGDEDRANVSVVFRAVSPTQSPSVSVERTALRDEFAFAAEGVYKSSTGELCMVGCKNSSRSSCNVRVSMFMPLELSVKQRDVLFGRFSSLEDPARFSPTRFGLFVPLRNLPRELSKALLYGYTKIEEASAMARREELETSLKDRLKLSLLKFPAPTSTLKFAEDLMIQSQLLSPPKLFLDMQVLAVEDVMITDWYVSDNDSEIVRETSKLDIKHRRVAVQITVSGSPNVSVFDQSSTVSESLIALTVSAEGVYDPETGKMHLVGCMHKAASSQTGFVAELDCNLRIVVKYPPKNTQWLINPIAEIRIRSTKPSVDIKLETFPYLYRDQLREIISRKTLEAVLSTFTLSLMVICIVLQLLHVRKFAESVPFISLIMLAIHAFGYSVPLITGAEALFARLTSSSSDDRSSMTGDVGGALLDQALLYLVKLLSLAAFLLMLRLCQKVIRSRIRLSSRFPLEPRRVPGEMKTLKVFLFIHLVGFCMVLVFHYLLRSSNEALFSGEETISWDGKRRKQEQDWMKELKEYVGLVEDLFLLPQVIAASIWEIKGKPLRPAYYLGITALRLLPHAYNAVSKPLFNPFFEAEASVFANPGMDFYSGVGDLMIPVMAVGLGGAVYAQQRWNGLRWGSVLRQGSSKLMRYGSRMYERLPSSKGCEGLSSSSASVKGFEAEMMPSTVEEEEGGRL